MPLDTFENRMPAGSPTTPVIEEVKPPSTEYTDIRDKVRRLADSWKGEGEETVTRRELRYMRVDVELMRSKGEIAKDAIITPIRVINDNITKEQAQYIAYLTTSRNTAIFKPKAKGTSAVSTQPVEEWFTKLCRYTAWELPHFRVLDGTQTHGTDFVEVVLDKDKPGHFGLEHIAHENCWYPSDLELSNFQDTPILVRDCSATEARLMRFANVNPEQVKELFKDTSNQMEVQATQRVQKVFYRKDGVVMVCWINHAKCSDFIRAPKPLFLGRKKITYDPMTQQKVGEEDIYETQYPIECLPYIISEEGKLKNVKGRAFFDEYVQEAVTSLASDMLNGYHRATLPMGAPSNPSSSGGAMEQTDCPIGGGMWYNQPGTFFNMPYPDASGMTMINAILTQNKAEAGQPNYAVGNRHDYASRKTSAEVQVTNSEASLLKGVQVTLYAIFLRNVYTRCWAIAQSRAQQGLLEEVDISDELLNMEYELYPAGDAEVIKRDEQKNNIANAWPIISTTPAAPLVLEDFLTLLFPQNAARYIAALRQNDPKQLVAGLTQTLQAITSQHPEVVPPGSEQQLGQLLQAGQQMGAEAQGGQQPAAQTANSGQTEEVMAA